MKAIFMRHYAIQTEDVEDIEEGKNFLEGGSDAGELFAIGIYDESTNTFHWEGKSYVCDISDEELLADNLENMKRLNIIPETIVKY